MNKEKITLAISLIFLFVYSSNTQGIQILEQKIISNQVSDCDMHLANIVLNDNNNILISMKTLLYANDNLIRIGVLFLKGEDPMEKLKSVDYDYCCNYLGCFARDNKFYMAFGDVNTVNIYRVQEKPEIINRIEPIESSGNPHYYKVITIPGSNNFCYLFGEYYTFPFNPMEQIRTLASAGHGVYYLRPCLAEIQNDKMVRYIKLDYGGKIDESYVVQEAVAGKDSIHFLGFRNIDVPFIGKRGPTMLIRPGLTGYGKKSYNFGIGKYHTDEIHSQPVILYYADYNLKKEKNIRKHKVYENTLGYNKSTDTYSEYGVLSADSKDDDIFVVFSWIEQKGYTKDFNIENTKSDIYYWQCDDKSYSKAEKIAEGFCPLVRVDLLGDVHVFWLDRSGNIVQKIKKGDKWSNEEIILSGTSTKSIIYTKGCSIVDEDRPEAILYTKFLAVEFDKENNLHAVYPTVEGLVYTKIKLE
jgi:hypothetical protein